MKNTMMAIVVIFWVFIALSNAKYIQCQEEERYNSTWHSVVQHQDPEWFRDAKFGIYCHWGPYSVPAYETEWYSHSMYVSGHKIRKHHVETYGPLSEFGYKDFIPMFKAEKWNPDEWAHLFKQAGARFAGMVVEHADGFAMWDSELTSWDAKDMGPERDLVGDLEKAIKQSGLKFIATYHRQWLYGWYPTLDPSTDASLPEYAGLYGAPLPISAFVGSRTFPEPLPDATFSKEWLERIQEVVDKYEPDLVWFDNKLDILHEKYRLDFLSHYYNKGLEWKKDVAVTYKHEEFYPGAGILDLERSRMSEAREFPWLTDDSVDWKSWGYISNPEYKTANRLIDALVDIVSKNGCLLLNIPPKPDGEIPLAVRELLLKIGQWLEVNGEAIYETRPWEVYGEGPSRVVEGHLSERQNSDATYEDIRFTRSKDNKALYVFLLGWPGAGETVTVQSLTAGSQSPNIQSLEMLGVDGSIDWSLTDKGLSIRMPEKPPFVESVCFKLTLQ
ncbi:MAG: alpha-L-fucosidase [Candidatus Hinthialibacter antarcticus]|nr:alpha-L-fucosidase [Candidatus Hinthialibacter antarcticus]